MLYIKRFIYNPVGVNTYVVSDDSGTCAIIDCGCWTEDEWDELKEYINDNHLKVEYLLNTHMHLDHVFGNQFVIRDLGLKPSCSPLEHPYYANLYSQVEMFFGRQFAQSMDYDFTKELGAPLNDGNIIQLGNEKLEVIFTPGHSPGGLCFYNADHKILISGDTLFNSSIGRTDLPGGNYSTLIKSIKTRLFTLPADTMVYPGHNNPTTIGFEMNHNPFV